MKTTTIFDAIRSGELNSVKNILSQNPDIINSLDQRGSTPLLLATYYGSEDITRTILQYNPEVNAQDASGNTALMGVCFKGYVTIAKMLIEAGADVNLKNYNESTPLIFAATFGQKEIIKLLLESGADPDHKDNRGYTAEMHAKNQGLDVEELFKEV